MLNVCSVFSGFKDESRILVKVAKWVLNRKLKFLINKQINVILVYGKNVYVHRKGFLQVISDF